MECFYQDERMLYIDPEECIDCEACVPECPVSAIFHEPAVPASWAHYVQLNAERAAVLKLTDPPLTEKLDSNSRG
jgi:ferredoxin